MAAHPIAQNINTWDNKDPQHGDTLRSGFHACKSLALRVALYGGNIKEKGWQQ